MKKLSQSHLREGRNPTIQIATDPFYPKTSGSSGFAAASYAGIIRCSASRATGTRLPDIRKRLPGDAAGTDASDEALIKAIGRGDRHAMALLYGRHHLKVYRFALRITSDPASAEDVVSDVFLDVWRRAGAFKARAQVSTWLLAIARNKSFSALRRASAEHLDCATIEVSDPSDNPEVLMHKKGRSEVIRKCLSKLSAVQREVIDLVYYHEKSVAEVARIVGVPANTVKTRMFHARQRIGALLHAAEHGNL
jgi:RNA polymerase sigma-70 factor (ECF subfamily)